MRPIDHYIGDYKWLSNFYPCEIVYEGLKYPSLENAYQAAKFKPEKRHLFQNCPAGYAKRLGKNRALGKLHGLVINPDWNNRRIGVMKQLLEYKFSYEHHPRLANQLVSTYPRRLIEGNFHGDQFWGVCDGKGENNLGSLQEDQREILMSEKDDMINAFET